jgi:hypothetical protein
MEFHRNNLLMRACINIEINKNYGFYPIRLIIPNSLYTKLNKIEKKYVDKTIKDIECFTEIKYIN